ncbi:shikimate kinase [Atopobacter phocae]|uniref:shikimate kinase n=1 Tax=Atopobacter phocae TaxID=136492 RepID=UPI00046E8927|nr:shikimate kinase [Atopobacter phocae]
MRQKAIIFIKKDAYANILQAIIRVISETIEWPIRIQLVDHDTFQRFEKDGIYLTSTTTANHVHNGRVQKVDVTQSALKRLLEPFKPLIAKEVSIIGYNDLTEVLFDDLCAQNVRHIHVFCEQGGSMTHSNDQIIYHELNEWKTIQTDFFIQTQAVELGAMQNEAVQAHLRTYQGISDLSRMIARPTWLGDVPFQNQLDWLIHLTIAQTEVYLNHRIQKPLRDKICHELIDADPANDSIFLVGLPAVGKSSVGTQLAKQLNYHFVDLDKEMIKRTGLSITQLYDQDEQAYRDLESELLREYGRLKRTVVSTGNGVVLRKENRDYLARSFVIHLDRPQKLMNYGVSTRNRPLLRGNPGVIKKMRRERAFYYYSISNCRVMNYKRLRTAQILTHLMKRRNDMHAYMREALSQLR